MIFDSVQNPTPIDGFDPIFYLNPVAPEVVAPEVNETANNSGNVSNFNNYDVIAVISPIENQPVYTAIPTPNTEKEIIYSISPIENQPVYLATDNNSQTPTTKDKVDAIINDPDDVVYTATAVDDAVLNQSTESDKTIWYLVGGGVILYFLLSN